MERVQTLINKLQDQSAKRENVAILLSTAQLLVAELRELKTVLPKEPISVIGPDVAVSIKIDEEIKEDLVPELTISMNSFYSKDDFEFDSIPTLSLQTKTDKIEINELRKIDTKSFNELFSEEKIEVVNKLKETPIRDLKKAIGINEKYSFINELFNGDESFYESSIKTINNLSVYPEADHWIRTELKTKLNWNAKSDTALYFDQLIKRRFA